MHLNADCGSLIEDESGVLNGFEESLGIRSTRSYVKRHTDNVEFQLLGQLKQVCGAFERSAKLLAQTTQAARVVGQDSEKQLGAREKLFGFVQLIRVVEGHLLDTMLGSITHIGLGLAGLGVDDAGRLHTYFEDLFDLGLRRAVKASA
jgi:hypothetical protein